MRFQTLGDKAEFIGLHVKAAEAIGSGQIVCLEIDGTDDGLSVALPATAGADHAYAYAFGVSQNAISSGKIGEVTAFGFCRKTRIRKNTRAASTDDWSSKASTAAGGWLLIDTVNGCLSGAGTGAVSSVAATQVIPFAILGENVASQASSAASDYTSDSRTAVTALVKSFLRMM